MDFKTYDSRKNFTLEEVARYWCEVEAPVKALAPEMLNRVQSRFRELKEAAEGGVLKVERSVTRRGGGENFVTRERTPIRETIHWDRSTIARVDLVSWFERQRAGERPAFLFPEARPGYWGSSGTVFDHMDPFSFCNVGLAIEGLSAETSAADEGKIRSWVEALEQSVERGELNATNREETGGLSSHSPVRQWKVSRADLRRWCEGRNLRPSFLFSGATTSTDAKQIAHSTPELVALREAILEFWENYDPKNPPLKKNVVAWIEAKNISPRLAAAIDTILRPVNLRKGGHRSRKG